MRAVTSSTVEFYDGLAPVYHLVYGDRWDEAVERQGAALQRIIRAERPAAADVLDCSCGIGTQAIGLARRGLAALAAMRAKLRRGGLLLVSVRDYDRALAERPATAPPLIVDGPPRRVVVRLHDWDGPDSPLYTVRFLILTERDGAWTVDHHAARYRAITRDALTTLVRAAGFTEPVWRDGPSAGFHQPVLTATAA
jgi:glycine/sarcosine N-methyltransferase